MELDRSEKVAFSYALGQAVTGVFCAKILDVQFLMHVDRYCDRYGVSFGPTRKRADLFGRGPGGWVVAEAKGRSNSMEFGLEQKLVTQKRSVSTVGGHSPSLALGCVASFPPGTSALRVDAFDPTKDDLEAADFDIELDRYILAYYEPFVTAIDFGEPDPEQGPYAVARIGGLNLRIGLLRSVVERMQEARGMRGGAITGLHGFVLSALRQGTALGDRTFRDGTLLDAAWDDAISIVDWDG